MILAEKIMNLRKKSGWSQEELADQLGISRQSVSKWESGASIPDLDKIIKMSSLFGVSTDYLLKDEMEIVTYSETDDEPQEVHSVSVELANEYMEESRSFAKKLAPAVSLCVLSPIPLIILGGVSDYKVAALSEEMAGAIGMGTLLTMVAIAVAVMIISGLRMGKYTYLEKEIISLQYGVAGIVQKRKKDFEKPFYTCIAIGVVSCILGVVPLIVTGSIVGDGFPVVVCVGVLLALIAFAVWFFVWSGVIYGSYQKLLQEGDFTEEKKSLNKDFERSMGFVPGVYWCIATAIYLGISFTQNNWGISWIVWPIAGVLFAALMGILRAVVAGKRKEV